MSARAGLSFLGFPFTSAAAFWRWIDACEESEIDSVWLSERIVGKTGALEPLTALAGIAGRTRRIKFGTDVIVLPLRDPVILAKECATIDYMSEGRFLPAFGVGPDAAPEWKAMNVSTQGRGNKSNEMLMLMNRLWSEDDVTHEGRYFKVDNITLTPKPKQSPLPIWIGGDSEAAIERTARYAHGWIGGSVRDPEVLGRVISSIKTRAEELGRELEPDHYGAGFSFRFGSWEEPAVERAVETFTARAGTADPRSYLAVGGPDEIIEFAEKLHAVGAWKFVLRPIASSDEEMVEQAMMLNREVIPHINKMS